MIHVYFLVDGRRDELFIPKLAESLLQTEFAATTDPWPRLHDQKGYRRKLLFAITRTRDLAAHGLVATVDRDKQPQRERLKKLRAARTQLRNAGDNLPVALGEANPHTEAWLLDDPAAVKEALALSPEVDVPNVMDVHPKDTLDALIGSSGRQAEAVQLLPEIASRVELKRCAHARQTGLKSFAKDLRAEVGPICRAASE